jgi:nucleoside-diphosphate-sugar epimerase
MDVLQASALPTSLTDETAVEDILSTPSAALIADLAALDGDIMVLGVGGKIGPTLARLAKRAAPDKRVIGVARFSDSGVRDRLESWGVETIVCDLLDRGAVAALPRAKNVVYMAGRKFGTAGDEPFTWAMNVLAPAHVAEVFNESRIVAFSTLCVTPFSALAGGGATEETEPGPPGEYANSCLGRERVFSYFSGLLCTPGRLIRLAYAIDMRYGVLNEIATKVRDGVPVDLTTGHVSIIWQGDASSQILRALGHGTTPTSPLNITAPAIEPVRALAEGLGRRLGRAPIFTGEDADRTWLINGAMAKELFGRPIVSTEKMLDWIADWVARDGASYGKPTHYDSRDGLF